MLSVYSPFSDRVGYRLIQFLDKYNILYQNQFGFRQSHSTHHALITLVDKNYNGDIVIGVFLDLKEHLIQLITKLN